MAKSFRCADAGIRCSAEVTGKDDEEVLVHAVQHARDVHGVDLTQSKTLVRYAHGLVRDDGRKDG